MMSPYPIKKLFAILFLPILTAYSLSAQPSEGGKVWLVAVGIGAYQQSAMMSRLDFTVQGAYDFVRLFEQRQLVTVDRPLVNQRAKRNDILTAMRTTFVTNPQVKPEDMIIFYFSGHGEIAGGKEGICPYEYNPNDIRGLIRNEEIEQLMSQSPARHKVCFIEACKTEVQTQGIIDPSILRNFNQQRRKIGSGLVFITSTEAGMPSLGNPSTIGGYFTHYLLEGLEGKANPNNDAYITVDELFGYLEREVSNYTNGLQIPQINDLGSYNPNLPLIVLPEKLNEFFPYPTKTFNGLRWMTQNLNVDVPDSWCYDDDPANCAKYGRLYTWEAAKRACASLGQGWRLPTDQEWRDLAKRFGGADDDASDGGKAAYEAMIKGGNNGFNAQLGGYRDSGGSFVYLYLGDGGGYWSATEDGNDLVWGYGFVSKDGKLNREGGISKSDGYSCRCVQD